MSAEPAITTLEILVVDDHAPTCALIERALRGGGAKNIRTADSARQALALLGERAADLIVTDLEMPEMDGFELVAAIRANAKFAHARILMISGFGDIQANSAGVDATLAKPIDAATLLRTVEAVLEQH